MERGRIRDDHCEHTSPTPPYIVRSPAAFPATKARDSCTLSQVPGSSPVAAFELAVPEGTVSGFAAMIAVTLIIWRLTLRYTYSVAFSVLLEQLSAEDIFHRFVLRSTILWFTRCRDDAFGLSTRPQFCRCSTESDIASPISQRNSPMAWL